MGPRRHVRTMEPTWTMRSVRKQFEACRHVGMKACRHLSLFSRGETDGQEQIAQIAQIAQPKGM